MLAQSTVPLKYSASTASTCALAAAPCVSLNVSRHALYQPRP